MYEEKNEIITREFPIYKIELFIYNYSREIAILEKGGRGKVMVEKLFLGGGGIAVGYIIIGIAAALGKWIGGLLLRFRFDEFVFFMVAVRKSGKKISVGLCDPQPYISCNMMDPKDTKMRNLVYHAFSMAVALFFTETVCIQMIGTKLMPKNAFTVPMVVVMVGYTLVLMFLFLANQLMRTGNKAAGVLRREYEKCYSAIKEGKAPGTLEIMGAKYTGKLTDLPVYKKYLLMCYYHYLDQGEYAKVKIIMDELENYVPDKWPQSELGILAEFVFLNVIIAPNEAKAKFYGNQFKSRLEGNEDINSKRVFAYWLLFVEKDKGAALQIAMEAMRGIDTYHLVGCRDMERKLIEALIKRIEAM